ncbi:hypothetical protein Glove_113g9 [Diversispora epigaea]|uniref:C3H1-type domain-containing protein n=1 Tax=Diversispora epigaea TaxID=1348612 RepID=A0A397J593_9GLOM|nr:hypothetical protein Glove_113g9 [Diversispora epigaea]
MNPAITTTTTTYKNDNNNNPSYIQIKPNKLVRAELLKNEFSQPKYIRTKPNVIVRAEVANNFNGNHPQYPNSYPSVPYYPRSPRIPFHPPPSPRNGYNSFRPPYNYNQTNNNDDNTSLPPPPNRPVKTKLINKFCIFFSKFGKCKEGDKCAYIHDPDRVAVCRKWLRENKCSLGDKCTLQHKKSPHVIPYCRHFSHGLCINRKCHYTHVRVNPKASRCEAFIKERYCPKGFDCKEKHEWSFPIFDDDEIEEAKKRKWDDSDDSNDEFKKDKKEESSRPKIRVKQEWEDVNEFSDGGFDFIPFEYPYEKKKSKLNPSKSPLKKLKR